MDHIIKSWNGKTIRFRADGYGCLTDMATANGKKVNDWTKTQQAKDYLEALSKHTNNTAGLLIETINEGSLEQMGTWAERKICIRFAQWCNPDFAVQVDLWVEELMLTGKTELKPMSPDEAIIQSLHLWRKQQEEIVLLQVEQQKHSEALIQQAVQIEVARVLAEQNQLTLASHQQEIDSLKAAMAALRQVINQPISPCKQTTRQRIVETTQLIGRVIYEKGLKSSLPEAMREAWARLLLKIKHSSSRRDLALLKTNSMKRYEQDLNKWKKDGGQKPKKKDYDKTYAEWIEHLGIEDEALTCTNAVAIELV